MSREHHSYKYLKKYTNLSKKCLQTLRNEALCSNFPFKIQSPTQGQTENWQWFFSFSLLHNMFAQFAQLMLFFWQILYWVYLTRKVNISSKTDVMKEVTDPTIWRCHNFSWSAAVMDSLSFEQKIKYLQNLADFGSTNLTFSNFGNVFSTICHHFWTSSTNFIVFNFSTYEVDYFLFKILEGGANMNKCAVTRHRFDICTHTTLMELCECLPSTRNYHQILDTGCLGRRIDQNLLPFPKIDTIQLRGREAVFRKKPKF